MRLNTTASFVLSSFIALTPCLPASAQTGDVNLYTHREPDLIKPILARFTAETGIKVNLVFAKSGLAERILSEGERSPADMLLSVDVATLTHAVSLGIAQPVSSPILSKAIPAPFRSADGTWHAVSMRARVIYASKERVKDTQLTYQDLADPRFKGRLCSRSGQHDYNIGLLSAAILHLGEDGAGAWLSGMRANLARKPSGGDRDIAKDIASGLCDVGFGNTYYVGLMQKDPHQKAWADAIRVIMPTFKNGGTHVNISGFIVTKHAKNRASAVRLGEWLVGPDVQHQYAAENFEYPITPGIPVQPVIASFGPLNPDSVALEEIAKRRKLASELVDKAGYDRGPAQ